jgi:outer membrane protein OmpA-like peptidoglycan-associated protein
MSEKLTKQVEKMTRQYEDLRTYFASGGATSDELAILDDVQKKVQALCQRAGTSPQPPSAGTGSAGDFAAGSRVGAEGAGRPRTETPGYKEESWVRPSTTVSGTPVQVGGIFFKTKDSTLGSREEGLLRDLAKAYSAYARRNINVAGGQRGLKGRVVGYADPRRSVEPDNKKLSAARATIVARRLTQFLAAESGLIEGDFDISVTAAGVLPAPKDDGPELEANSLATLRRADIFLEGGVLAKTAPKAPTPPKPDPMVLLDVMNLGMDDAFLGRPSRANQFEKAPPFKAAYRKGWERGLKALAEKPTTMKGISKEEQDRIVQHAKRKELAKKSREYLKTWWSINLPGD